MTEDGEQRAANSERQIGIFPQLAVRGSQFAADTNA